MPFWPFLQSWTKIFSNPPDPWISISRGRRLKTYPSRSDQITWLSGYKYHHTHQPQTFPPKKKKNLTKISPLAEFQKFPPNKATGEKSRQNPTVEVLGIFPRHHKTAELSANLHGFFSRKPRRGKWYSTPWFFGNLPICPRQSREIIIMTKEEYDIHSAQIIIFHKPRFPWIKGISRNLSYLLGAQVMWGRYHLTRSIVCDLFFFPQLVGIYSSFLNFLTIFWGGR